MSDPTITSLGQAFPLELPRAPRCWPKYKTIPTGQFGALMLEGVLKRADDAAISGDLVALLRSYAELKQCQ